MSALLIRVHDRMRHTADDDRGFTLLEVMVSFVLFAIVAASATTAIVSALKASHGSQQTVDAANVAQTFIASTQANTAVVVGEDHKVYSASVKNEDFQVTRTITFTPSRTQKCIPGTSFTVNVVVAQMQTGKFLARSDAVVTC